MDEDPPAPPAKPSQVPSWVTLGFALGALFVLALPRRDRVEAESHPAVEAIVPTPARPAAPPRISTIEAVFAIWGKYAVWSDDTTEVALWNAETKSFSDCFEVVRAGNEYYFRTISRLTRPVLVHGVADESPLQFTESPVQREEWLSEVGKENARAFTESLRQSFSAPTAEPTRK